ncbi:MAG: hypothetical protein M3R27_07730 [Bacteroidota bacterium]|nr:hypothetical protein [Bacteroidota bacterium]
MTQQIIEIIGVFLLSTVKFVFGGVPVALGLGFSFFKAVFVTSLGGCTGVIIFVYMSEWIMKRIKVRAANKRLKFPHALRKNIFTRKNKSIVKIKMKFGLLGIAFITPLLLSIPLGCFLAVRYFKDKPRIIAVMFGAILFWSISTASFELFF